MTWLVIPPAALVMLLPVPSAAQSIAMAHGMTIDPSHVRKRQSNRAYPRGVWSPGNPCCRLRLTKVWHAPLSEAGILVESAVL